jgi:hypothetical protein
MAAIATFLHLALAACLSGATAGLLLAMAIFSASHWAEPVASWTPARLRELLALAELGLTLGIVVASWPAFAAGSAMWAIGRRSQAARHGLAWAAAGSAVGALVWTLLELAVPTSGGGARLGYADAGILAACLAAGAGAALAFRATMRVRGGRGHRSAPSAAPSGSPRRAGHIRRSDNCSRP